MRVGLLIIIVWGMAQHLWAEQSSVEEVLVQARKSDFTEITEGAEKLVSLPGALGDPLLATYSLPGVLASDGDLGAPAVRGSGPSDNLYLVDGIPAGYIFHVFSTSIFNENILQNFDLYSAGFGPQYGNVTGGVFDIRLRQPKHTPLKTTLDISILRAGIMTEGAVTDASEFYVSGRYSLLQFFMNKEDSEKKSGIRVESAPQDSDYQAKYLWHLNADNHLTLSANGATDFAEAAFTDKSDLARKNPDFLGSAKIETNFNNQSLRWQYAPQQESEWNIYLGNFAQRSNTYWSNHQYYFDQRWQDNLLKITYAKVWDHQHNLSFGTEYHDQTLRYSTRQVLYLCTSLDPDCQRRREGVISDTPHLALPMANFYLNDHWGFASHWQWDLGAQFQRNDYNNEEFINPRTALAWQFTDGWTATAAAGKYTRMQEVQYIVPKAGNPNLTSQQVEHYTLGLQHELPDNWSWSLNTYLKNLDHLALARAADAPATDPLFSNNAAGKAYGVDVLINKGRTDKWFGWMTLGYAKSTRTNSLTGETRDYYLDTPVVLNVVANYQFMPRWNGGLRLVMHTGQADTPIIDIKQNPDFPNRYQPVYGEAFSQNLPTYARLDIRLQKESEWMGYKTAYTFDILNVTNRKNVTSQQLDYDKVDATHSLAIEKAVGLGLVPSIGYKITF